MIHLLFTRNAVSGRGTVQKPYLMNNREKRLRLDSARCKCGGGSISASGVVDLENVRRNVPSNFDSP